MSVFQKLKNTRLTNAKTTNKRSVKELYEQFRLLEQMPSPIQDYIISRYSLGYSPATLQRYLYDYKSFFDFIYEVSEEDFQVEDISSADFAHIDKQLIEDYGQFLYIHTKNSARTIQRKLSALKSLFDYFIQQKIVLTNPVNEVERPKIARQEPTFLHRHEYEQLLAFILTEAGLTEKQKKYHERLKYRDVAIFQMLLMTGLRISELCSLQMKDIHFSVRELSVVGKGNKQRTIPLNSAAIEALTRYFQSLPPDARPTEATANVFVGYNFQNDLFQNSLTVSALQKMISRHLKRASAYLPFLAHKKMSAHKLRHSFATALVRNGVDVLTVQNLLGHESVATTQMYAHVQKEAKEKAINTLQ